MSPVHLHRMVWFRELTPGALRKVNDAQVSLSPGFRWGTSVLPGQPITMDNVMDQTGITYPETYRQEMSGADIKAILEDVCDNLFNVALVQQEHGVLGTGFGERSGDTAGTGAHVGASVATDLGLIPHATEGQPHVFPGGGPGDALGQARLANTGRANKT